MAVGRGCLVQFLRCGFWVRGGGPFFSASPGGATAGPWTLGYCGDEQRMDQMDRGPLNLYQLFPPPSLLCFFCAEHCSQDLTLRMSSTLELYSHP